MEGCDQEWQGLAERLRQCSVKASTSAAGFKAFLAFLLLALVRTTILRQYVLYVSVVLCIFVMFVLVG